jgi:hypothetical protein
VKDMGRRSGEKVNSLYLVIESGSSHLFKERQKEKLTRIYGGNCKSRKRKHCLRGQEKELISKNKPILYSRRKISNFGLLRIQYKKTRK